MSRVCQAKPDNIFMSHPYTRFESDPLWPILERAIADLVANGDLQETTDRAYIVGYLCPVIREGHVASTENPMAILRSTNPNA